MTRRYRATTFSIAVAGALAIAACSTDDGGGATVCTEVTLYRFIGSIKGSSPAESLSITCSLLTTSSANARPPGVLRLIFFL